MTQEEFYKQTSRKYGFTDETLRYDGHLLHRIVALENFGDISKGDTGGWVASEQNLSQEGTCWVFDEAKVYGNSTVSDDAVIFGNARAFGDSKIYGRAVVFGCAKIYGKSRIFGCSKVYSEAEVYGDARLSGDVEVRGGSLVGGKAEIFNTGTKQ